MGKENGYRNSREAAPGDGVMLGGVVLVQRRHGKVSQTSVLLLSLTSMVQKSYHENVARILGH